MGWKAPRQRLRWPYVRRLIEPLLVLLGRPRPAACDADEVTSHEQQPQVGTMHQPVMNLANVLQELFRREEQLDDLEVQGKLDQEQIEAYRRLNLEAIEAIEQAISCLAATELREAVVQVLIATGHLNSLNEGDGCESPPARPRLTLASRLLRSALPVLAAQAQIDLKDYGGKRYGLFSEPWPFLPETLDADGGPAKAP